MLMIFNIDVIIDGGIRVFWTYHHAVMDGWSLPLIMDKWLSICYGEKRLFHYIPFKEHIEWLFNQAEDNSMSFWVTAMSNIDKTLPLSFPKPSVADVVPNKYASITETIHLPDLNFISKLLGVTASSIFRAAWAILLSQYTRSEFVKFGTVVSGRDTGVDQTEKYVISLFR